MTKDIEQLAKEKGIRLTEQRKVIAQVINESKDHPNVEELYNRASKIDKNISIATAYRTVKLFSDNNLIEKHDFGDGISRYEAVPKEHHDHLIDVRNDKIIEFCNEEIEELQKKIADKLGYELVDHRLELYAVPKKTVVKK